MTDRGKTDKIKGKAKEVTGDVTNSKKTKAEGLLDQAVGKVKEVASDVKEKTEEVVEDVKEKLDKKQFFSPIFNRQFDSQISIYQTQSI